MDRFTTICTRSYRGYVSMDVVIVVFYEVLQACKSITLELSVQAIQRVWVMRR